MKILLVGPSHRVTEMDKSYFEEKRDQGFTVVSYTGSIKYLQDIGFTPDYYSFLDPLTIGSKIEKYEQDPYFNSVSLLIADLYSDDLKGFFECGYTCNKLLRRQDLFDKFRSLQFMKNFKHVYSYRPEVIDLRDKDNHTKYQNFKNNLVLFSAYKQFNMDKFTCYLMPLVFRRFDNISEIRCIGFGDFTVDRIEKMTGNLSSGKKMDGYDAFKNTSQMISPVIREYLSINEINITFEHENWFSSILT